MRLPIETIQDGAEIRFEDEDTFVTFDGVSAIMGQPDFVNVWVVGDKLPTRVRKGQLFETR
jgi:hypothetical protein